MVRGLFNSTIIDSSAQLAQGKSFARQSLGETPQITREWQIQKQIGIDITLFAIEEKI